MTKIYRSLGVLVILATLFSCTQTNHLVYFSDQKVGEQSLDSLKQFAVQRIQKLDRLNITISSTDPSLTSYLNPFGITANSGNLNNSGYLVSLDGNIDFPLLGKVPVYQLTTDEVSKLLKDKLTYYYKDLFVNVNLSGKVYIINGTEGTSVPITNERLTILEAMSLSGVKTDNNPKNDVWIVREDSGKRYYAKMNLTSKKLFESNYYYLKSNDLIYIKPNAFSWIISPNSPVRLVLTLIGSISALIILITKL